MAVVSLFNHLHSILICKFHFRVSTLRVCHAEAHSSQQDNYEVSFAILSWLAVPLLQPKMKS